MKTTKAQALPWKKCTLGDAIKLQRGFDLPGRLRRAGLIPIVSSSGITDYHQIAAASGPGVVTGRYGTIGEVFYVEGDYWPLNTTLYVKDFKGNSPLFISHLLKTVDFASHSGKSGVPGVNRNDLHELEISLPPLAEQNAIASALSDMDALLAKLDQLIAKKRDIKQAAMQELLTGRRRLPGHGNIQWRAIRLGDVLAVRHGKSQHEVVKSGGEYPILASGGEIGRTDHWLYNKPSVLIGRKGTIDNPLYVDRPFWTIDTLFYTEIDTTIAVEKYIYYVFKLIDWRSYNEASGVPSLSSSTISSINFKCPPREEQAEIAALLTDMDTEITALEARREKTLRLKQGMMQELLSGRVRLI